MPFHSGDIITLNATTGNQTAILSEHIESMNSLTFSSDGRLLVSGDDDYIINLWDIQTGRVIKRFSCTFPPVHSVSISVEYTGIASASECFEIYLWGIQIGECYQVKNQMRYVSCISFTPKAPQHLSICQGRVWWYDINGHWVRPVYDSSHVAFSPDGTQVVLCDMNVVAVQTSSSGVIVVKFHIPKGNTCHGCFSPDGRLVAAAANNIAYVWDITSSEPHLIEPFIGHTKYITSLVFFSPSSLISVSFD